MALCGFIFYLAIGAKLLSTNIGKLPEFPKLLDEEKIFGSLCIVTALIFLVDSIISGIKFKQKQRCALCQQYA